MDEMTRLRELRADAPVPHRAALAPGRKRLTDSIEGGSRRTFRLRADWRIASLGAVVAITAAALFVTQIVDTSDPRQSGPATVAGDLDLSSPAGCPRAGRRLPGAAGGPSGAAGGPVDLSPAGKP